VIVPRREPFSIGVAPRFAEGARGVLSKVCSLLVLLWVWDAPRGWAQGTVVLRTGGGSPLVTFTELVSVPSNALPIALSFEFGFGTDETPSPGVFLDSFSVTVQDAARLNTLVLLTADGSGIVWAPPTPGGVGIPPDAILRSSIPFPSLTP
jgi:hypothetical protein